MHRRLRIARIRKKSFKQLRQQEDRAFIATLGGFDNSRRLESQHFGSLLNKQAQLFSGMQQNTRDTMNALTGGDSYVTAAPIWATDADVAQFRLRSALDHRIGPMVSV
jgi:hypothetical protein